MALVSDEEDIDNTNAMEGPIELTELTLKVNQSVAGMPFWLMRSDVESLSRWLQIL